MVDYLCDVGAFSKSIYTHVYIRFNISDPPPPGNWRIPENIREMCLGDNGLQASLLRAVYSGASDGHQRDHAAIKFTFSQSLRIWLLRGKPYHSMRRVGSR